MTSDDVLKLAPDPASAKSGRELSNPKKWVSIGVDDSRKALWGECQGSGSKPYQVQADLSSNSFKCSCPSRKFPCKHGIGLMLIYFGKIVDVKIESRPAWVEEWISNRQAKAEKKAAAPPKEIKPIDPEAQAAKRDKKLKTMLAGLSELQVWLADWMKSGIATAPNRGWDDYDSRARRLIDAQAPGAARRVREMAYSASSGAGWQSQFLEKLGELHLLTQASVKLPTLESSEQDDIFAALGVPVTAAELANLPAIQDTWQIVSRVTEEEEKLRVQRTWLVGMITKKAALILHFAHGTTPFEKTFITGTQFDGEVVYYPGRALRGIVKTENLITTDITKPIGYATLDAAFDEFSQLYSQCPWLERFVVPLLNVVPIKMKNNDAWLIIDQDKNCFPLTVSEQAGWQLLAKSGGQPINVVLEFDGQKLSLLNA